MISKYNQERRRQEGGGEGGHNNNISSSSSSTSSSGSSLGRGRDFTRRCGSTNKSTSTNENKIESERENQYQSMFYNKNKIQRVWKRPTKIPPGQQLPSMFAAASAAAAAATTRNVSRKKNKDADSAMTRQISITTTCTAPTCTPPTKSMCKPISNNNNNKSIATTPTILTTPKCNKSKLSIATPTTPTGRLATPQQRKKYVGSPAPKSNKKISKVMSVFSTIPKSPVNNTATTSTMKPNINNNNNGSSNDNNNDSNNNNDSLSCGFALLSPQEQTDLVRRIHKAMEEDELKNAKPIDISLANDALDVLRKARIDNNINSNDSNSDDESVSSSSSSSSYLSASTASISFFML